MEAGALQAPAGLGRLSISAPLLRLRSDEQLVALFRAGNDDAFQVIFDRYRQRLFAYTRQMLGGSRQDAEDALQDVFLRAYGALRASERPVSLRAWLYRVAHNRCVDQLRRPVPASADVLDVSRPPLRDPLEESQRREDLRRLVADVGRLPEAQRSALLMREMDGLSYQELADALDVTIPAIKSLLVRARIGLVEAIEARDTACVEIRTDLLSSHDRGVRASGRARRHLRDCRRCRAYRSELRTVRRGLGALSPEGSSPLSVLAKLFGLGGGAGGAAAGGGALVGGGGATVVGGGVASVTACKVAALVCSAALATGAAQRVERAVKHAVVPAPSATHARHAGAQAAATLAPAHLARLPAPTAAPAAHGAAAAAGGAHAHHPAVDGQPSAAVADAQQQGAITPDGEVYTMADPVLPGAGPPTAGTGGAGAPAEDQAIAPAPAPAIAPATGTPAAATAPATTPPTGAPAPGSAAPATAARPPAGSGTTSPSPTTVGGAATTTTTGATTTGAPTASTSGAAVAGAIAP